MTRRFDTQSDGGVDMEVAMAATVFRDLQAAGHIPAGTRLADEPPRSAAGFDGTSYEARLVELITDSDGDNRLDLDVDRLRSAGILGGSPTTDTVERDLSNGAGRLSDEFVGRQDSRSEMSDYGIQPNTRGRRIQTYSERMTLESNQDRSQQSFISEIPGRATSTTAAHSVAQEAIAGAQLLNTRGDQNHAQTLLRETGGALMNAGRRDAAAEVFTELTRAPYADTSVNLLQRNIDSLRSRTGTFSEGGNILMTRGGTSSSVDTGDFRSTYGEMAQMRLNQIQVHDRMETTLGRTVDPNNMDDARAYLQSYSEGADTDAVRGEYQNYMEAFFVHSGQGVTWDETVSENDRPDQLTSLLATQPQDDAGRTLVDCEGFSYMTDTLLGGITDESGDNRFNVAYASRPGHVITAAFDRTSGEAFSVNNDNTEMLTGDLSTNVGRTTALGEAIAGNHYNVIAFADNPAGATATTTEEGRPAVGAIVWDGNRAVGTVTQQMQDDYHAWSSQRFGGGSISQYIGALDRGTR